MKHPYNRGQRISCQKKINKQTKEKVFRSRYYEPFLNHPTYVNLSLYDRNFFRTLSDLEKEDLRLMRGRFADEPFYIQERSNGLEMVRFCKKEARRAGRRARKSLKDMGDYGAYRKEKDLKRELY